MHQFPIKALFISVFFFSSAVLAKESQNEKDLAGPLQESGPENAGETAPEMGSKFKRDFSNIEVGKPILISPPEIKGQIPRGTKWPRWTRRIQNSNRILAYIENVNSPTKARVRAYRDYTPIDPSYDYYVETGDVEFTVDLDASVALPCEMPKKYRADDWVYKKNPTDESRRVPYRVLTYYCNGEVLVQHERPLVREGGKKDTGLSLYVFRDEELEQEPNVCPEKLMVDAKKNQIIQFEKAKGQIRHAVIDFGICVGDAVVRYVVKNVTKRVKLNRQVEYQAADCGNESSKNGANTPMQPAWRGCEVNRNEIVSMEYIIPDGVEGKWYWGFKEGDPLYYRYPDLSTQNKNNSERYENKFSTTGLR